MTLKPLATMDEATRRRGMRILTGEVMFSSACDAIVMGTILTAYALQLGAKPSQIGLLATVAFWAQLLQAPGVLLVERLRRRKLIAVVGSLISSTAPAAMTALAFASATGETRMALVAAVSLYCGAGAFAGCAWNAWTRDLVPDEVRGRFAARRARLGMAVNIGIGLAAAAALDLADVGTAARPLVFAALFALAFAAQLASVATLAAAPEPMMPPAPPQPTKLRQLLAGPLRDERFRPLVAFNAAWQFAVNLAQPYFTVFFLQQLGFGVTFVMVLTLISQFANGWALRRWGPLVDRFGAKSVLNVAAPAFILCIAAMTLAGQFGPRGSTAAYLVLLHVLMGIAASGVSLGTGTIALKLSPAGEAAPYLSVNALVSSAAGGLAPLLGGLAADLFAERRMGLSLHWSGPRISGEILGVELTGWSFYFALSALLGLYALHRLALVREDGALPRREMLHEIIVRARSRFGRPPAGAGADAPEQVSSEMLKG